MVLQVTLTGCVPTETDDLILARQLIQSGAGKEIRERLGLSRAELGASMNPPVSDTTIWRWEKGLSRPRGVGARSYVAALRRMRSASKSFDLLVAS